MNRTLVEAIINESLITGNSIPYHHIRSIKAYLDILHKKLNIKKDDYS